jgi:hypothetical protein
MSPPPSAPTAQPDWAGEVWRFLFTDSVCEPGSMLPSILSAPIVALSQDFR